MLEDVGREIMRHTITDRVTHDDVMLLLRRIPGKSVMRSVLQSLFGSGSDVYYSSRCEFRLGRCGVNNEPSRIDAIVEVRCKPSSAGTLRIGLEIKTTLEDLVRSDNLREKYIHSGHCDYYFLLASTGELALKACVKYDSVPGVGVVSLDSATVYKVPERSLTTLQGRSHYVLELCRRAASTDEDAYHSYHVLDNEWIKLEGNGSTLFK